MQNAAAAAVAMFTPKNRRPVVVHDAVVDLIIVL